MDLITAKDQLMLLQERCPSGLSAYLGTSVSTGEHGITVYDRAHQKEVILMTYEECTLFLRTVNLIVGLFGPKKKGGLESKLKPPTIP